MVLEQTVAARPAAPAVMFGDQILSYAQLDARASRVAHLLAGRGIGPGDRVALSCPNVPYFVEIFWGVAKLGATLVPIDIGHGVDEVAERARGCRAHLAFEALGSIPIGDIAWAAHDGEREFFLITIDTGFPEPLEPPEFYHPLVAQQPDVFAGTTSLASSQAPDPDGRWLLLIPLADEAGLPVLVDAATAGAAVVLIPQIGERLIADTRARAAITRTIG